MVSLPVSWVYMTVRAGDDAPVPAIDSPPGAG